MRPYTLALLMLAIAATGCKKDAGTPEYSTAQNLGNTNEIVMGNLNGTGFYWYAQCFEFVSSYAEVSDEVGGTTGKRRLFQVMDTVTYANSFRLYTPAYGNSQELTNILTRGSKSIGTSSDFYMELQVNGKTYTTLGDQAGSEFRFMEAIRCRNYRGIQGTFLWIHLICNLYEKGGSSTIKWSKYPGGRSPYPNIIAFIPDNP